MATGVGAAVGVVSTVAQVGEQSRQRKISRQQAQVQQYTQEVQYQQEKSALAQQKEYARQTRELERIQLAAQDQQVGNALNEQALEQRQEEAQLSYQLAQKQLQDKSALNQANAALDVAQYQLGEQARQRTAANDGRASQETAQVSQQVDQVAKFLQDGNVAQAAALLMDASQGQQDSTTSQLMQDRRRELLQTTTANNNASDALRGTQEQRTYENDVSSMLRELGQSDVDLERLGARTGYSVNDAMTRAQQDLLDTGTRKNRIGEQLAQDTFRGGVALRDQQRGIDSTFSDMGYQASVDNAGVRNAGLMSSIQAQQQASRGSLFTTLANTAAIGGSLYNAYQMVKPVDKPTQRTYKSPSMTSRTRGTLQDVTGLNNG